MANIKIVLKFEILFACSRIDAIRFVSRLDMLPVCIGWVAAWIG